MFKKIRKCLLLAQILLDTYGGRVCRNIETEAVNIIYNGI